MQPSQLLRKLAAYPRQNELAAARREVGRIERSLFMIDPSILGTLFEHGLDPGKRAELGAHYTDRDKISARPHDRHGRARRGERDAGRMIWRARRCCRSSPQASDRAPGQHDTSEPVVRRHVAHRPNHLAGQSVQMYRGDSREACGDTPCKD